MPVKIEKLTHTYMKDSPFEATAIFDINLEIEDGEFIGLIGHTGSGKSTLIQHLNGLLLPTEGSLLINGIKISKDSKKLSSLRQKVGLVFQYPEHQLFEETVYKDIGFGPKNLGLSEEEIDKRIKESIALVGLDHYRLFTQGKPNCLLIVLVKEIKYLVSAFLGLAQDIGPHYRYQGQGNQETCN